MCNRLRSWTLTKTRENDSFYHGMWTAITYVWLWQRRRNAGRFPLAHCESAHISKHTQRSFVRCTSEKSTVRRERGAHAPGKRQTMPGAPYDDDISFVTRLKKSPQTVLARQLSEFICSGDQCSIRLDDGSGHPFTVTALIKDLSNETAS